MKKPLTICLALVAATAIILSCVFGSQKAGLEKQLTETATARETAETAKAELETVKADLEKQLSEANDALKTAKEDLEKQTAAAAAAAETAKAEAEKKLTEAVTAKETAEADKAELEAKLAEAVTAKETAETAKTETEKQLTEATAAKEAAEKAKGETEKQLTEATAAKEAAEKAKGETEKQLTEANAALETAKGDLEKHTAEAATAAETAKADAEKQLTEAATARETAETAKAELEAKVAELETRVAELEGSLEKADRALNAERSNAYIMYANADWTAQNWGTADSEDGRVRVTPANVTGEGDYTVGLEFAEPAEGLAFAALGIRNGEYFLPFYSYRINAIRVNGEPVEFKKGYTSSDDGKETRVNIFNEWVTAVPEDAHTENGDLTDVSPIIVDREAFASVSSMEVDFTAVPLKAYLMYANADWSIQYFNDGTVPEGVTPVTAPVTGEGSGMVGLEFAQPSEGLAFTAVGIKNGEKMIPGYIIQVTGIYLNDSEENILQGKSYTNSDDGTETRANIFNEWVTELPADARTADGKLEDASSRIVDPALFTGVSKVTVTYDLVKGKPAAPAEAPAMTKEEADALKANGFRAYIGVQSNTYVFRNAWNDRYGLNDEENPFFGRLTGWDESNNAVDYGGTFSDAEIKADGEYTVSLTTGEMGFGTSESFNLLFVSTDIPSALVTGGYLTIGDVKTKIGDAATREYTEIDTSGEYAMIKVIDTYNQAANPFGYTVPGPETAITVTFSVSGFAAE